MDLTNRFLISTRQLDDSIFADTVIYVCRHDSDGAFGIVINKPSETSADKLLASLEVKHRREFKNMVLQGGPVKQEQVLVLHSPPDTFDVTIKVGDDVGITLSNDILQAISENRAPKKITFAFGYSGWKSGQLEKEIQDNAWIVLPASSDIIFDEPESLRLMAAARRSGFDMNDLADITGHA